MADATYKVIGLSKKKGKSAETSEADYTGQPSPRGEKEKNLDKAKSDDYYDDRLSRDSQLDSHLKELVSDGQDNGEMGGLVGGVYVEQETDDQVTDEFYDEADKNSEVTDQPADINLAGDIYTPAAIEEMLGDWGTEQISPPSKADQSRHAATAGQNASSVSSELLINISDRYETQDEGRRTPVELRLAAQITFVQEQLNAALSQVTVNQEQLNAALSRVTVLEERVAGQREFITTQLAWNKSMSAETEQLSSRLVSTDAKAEAAHTIAKAADSTAKRAADTANKSMQAAISHQSRLKALEASMTQISKKQDTLSQQMGSQAARQPTAAATLMDDTFENSIFFGGIQAFRDRLGLHPHSDPIFVISRLMRDMGIYAGMDSIVLADNAAKSRLEVRAVIIHMQSSFHKRAAMAILRRELASQRLPGTAVRDCFPTSVMTKVKTLNRLGMRLKSAGKITKFQVINRKGLPILQTGVRNQNYTDYQGDAGEEEDEEDTGNTAPWTLVENRKKRPIPEGTLTSPNSRPLVADRSLNPLPATTTTTWAALTEQEFPELVSQSNTKTPSQPQPVADKSEQSATASAKVPSEAAHQRKRKSDQPKPSGEATGAGATRGSQPGSYPVSRASSRSSSRPSSPPPIRSLFDDDRSAKVTMNMKPKPQRQPKSKAAQHQDHLRKDY